jgi:hypothetical protein
VGGTDGDCAVEEVDTDNDARSMEEAGQAVATVATEQRVAKHGNASEVSQHHSDLALGSFRLRLAALPWAYAECMELTGLSR